LPIGPLPLVVEPELWGGDERDEIDALGARQRLARAAPVDDRHDEHRLGAERANDPGRLERGGASGDGVLDDAHAVTRFESAGETAGDPVVLRLLADAERPEAATAGGGHRGEAEGDRVGAGG